jgi:hypothetical protein
LTHKLLLRRLDRVAADRSRGHCRWIVNWRLGSWCESLGFNEMDWLKTMIMYQKCSRYQAVAQFLPDFHHSITFASDTDYPYIWARGSVVDSGTMLQAGRSQVQFPMRLLDFFSIYPILPTAQWPWGRLSP